MKSSGEKRGQVTIFIILAIVIVAAGILIFLFYPKISVIFQPSAPSVFMKSCVLEDIEKTIDTIAKQGGVLEPDNYILYNNEKIEYGCYTNEYYKTCVMQSPLLQRSIENEIENIIQKKSTACFQQLKEQYEQKGYKVSIENNKTFVEFLPHLLRIDLQTRFTTSKETTTVYDNFDFDVRSELYDLISVASSILNWEARYGDAETTVYMAYYPNVKVEKQKLGEGSTIYIISYRLTKDKFQFASRSLVLPPGYGTQYVG